MKALLSVPLTLIVVALAGCTVHQTTAPGLTGPSDLALSMHVTALPDSISQDGGSQSSIQVTAIGPDGKGVAALPLRMDMFVNGVGQDYGTLSARTIVTNSNGVATVVYTAPPSPAGGVFGTCQGLPGNCVQVAATASGLGFATAAPQMVTIRLVPPGVILPPAGSPTAAFTTSPTPVLANVPVTFDASSSTVGAGASSITSYSWSFGDNSAAGNGRTVTHTFTTQQTFNVTLTIVNDRGLSAFTTVALAVGALATPSANFVFSPGAPAVGQTVSFNANQSTAAPGHALTAFNWDFGDGTTASGLVTSHVFTVAGTFNVVLSVMDDTGQKATASQAVTASAGGVVGSPVANFTSSPVAPAVNEVVVFDSSSSTSATGRTLTDYAWNFGDDTPIVHGNNRIISHTYTRAGTFVVNLVLTDSSGATGQKSATVPVGTGNPVAILQVFKTGGNSIQADGSASTSSGNSTIVNYTFFWGDGTSTTGAASTAVHTYAAAGSYSVTLRVTDSVGRLGTSLAQSVTVP